MEQQQKCTRQATLLGVREQGEVVTIHHPTRYAGVGIHGANPIFLPTDAGRNL